MFPNRSAASVRRFPVDGGLLLLDAATQRLFAFNETARDVWDLMTQSHSGAAMTRAFAERWGLPLARATDDIATVLAQWRDLGLLHGTAAGRSSRGRSGCDPDACDGDLTDGPAVEWICTFRDVSVAFSAEAGHASRLRTLFGHMETPGAAPRLRIALRGMAGGATALVADGVERLRTADPGQLMGAVYQCLLEAIHPGVGWLGLLHGAALARDGVAIGLAGPSGSGKSTLAAGLIAAGFDYLTDDLIALAAPGGTVVPWPLPLSIKPGSVQAVAACHPGMADAPRYRTKGLEARLLLPPVGAWDAPPMRLGRLVFPRFALGAAPTLQPLRPFDSLQRLIADRVWLGDPISEARVAAFLSWIKDTPCFAATYGSLDDGVRLIEGIAA